MNLDQILAEAFGEPREISKARQADALATQLILVKDNEVADAVEIALQAAVVLMVNFRKNSLEQAMRSLHPLLLMAITDHLSVLHDSFHLQEQMAELKTQDAQSDEQLHLTHRRDVLGVTSPEALLNASFTGRMFAMFSHETPAQLNHTELVATAKAFSEELDQHAKAHKESKAAKETNNVH